MVKNGSLKTASKLSAELEDLSMACDQRVTFFQAIRELCSSRYRVITMQCLLTMFSSCMCYYGFLLNPASLSGNLLANHAAMAMVDAGGQLIYGLFGNKVKRVRLLQLSFHATAIFIFADIFMPNDGGQTVDIIHKIIGIVL